MAAQDEEFATTESGASKSYPMQCSSLRKGGFVLIKGHPCKIVEMSTSKTGKHGHAKVHMVALDIFTGRKYEELCPSTHNMDVPNVLRKDYQLTNIDEGFLSLMDDAGDTRDDIKLPEGSEVGEEIQKKFDNDEAFLVTILKAMDQEMAIATKAMTK